MIPVRPAHPMLRAALGAILAFSSAMAGDPVTAERAGGQLIVRSGKKEILRYQVEPGDLPRPEIKALFRRGGYIGSVLTPAGVLVTDDFPPNHLHHHGVWTAWTKTSFEGRQPDFWNMGDGKGRVEAGGLESFRAENGEVQFTAWHSFVDMTATPEKVALQETWKVTVSAPENRYVIDLTSTQTCATAEPLKLPKYHYGGIGFRGHRTWDGAPNCRFLTSNGETDRLKVNESKARWCWIGGSVEGKTGGIAVLGHPENYRAPQPLRAHPTEPFLCFAPQQGGDMEIAPGKPYVSRYRLIVFDGEPDARAIEGWWDAWTAKKP